MNLLFQDANLFFQDMNLLFQVMILLFQEDEPEKTKLKSNLFGPIALPYIGLHSVVDTLVDFEPIYPRFESR